MIPKPAAPGGKGKEDEGLGVGWPAKKTDMEALKRLLEEMKAKM
jgi:hypothetical protein